MIQTPFKTEMMPLIFLWLTIFVLAYPTMGDSMTWYYTCGLTVASILMYVLQGWGGVTMTFHRYYSHHSFEFRWPWLRYVFAFFGCMGLTGAVLGWVALHRDHHRYADTHRDPHSPVIWGWKILLGVYEYKFNKFTVRDLVDDPILRWMQVNYFSMVALWVSLLGLIGYFTIGTYTMIHFFFVIPAFLQVGISKISNYFTHLHGTRVHPTIDNSRNVGLWLAILTGGEGGDHNAHHAFPGRWYFNSNPWRDPTGYMIRLVKA